MPLRWSVANHDSELIQSIEHHCQVSPVVAQILAVRGITHPDQIHSFFDLKMTGLRPPQELPGLNEAVDRIHAAILAKQKIVVYGDYDCDGMTSTAILFRCIEMLGGSVGYFVPNRMDDGYGVNTQALEKLKQRGAEFIVTVDCGVNSIEEARAARELGLQMVVSDHHVISGPLPDVAAVVHPLSLIHI